MSVDPGARLGSYVIEARLGAGGMGEVYRARDTRLDRDVAIKVLSAHLAHEPASVERFAREAKAVAALSHPNILAIFDVGTAHGVAFAAMELLEGETLRERLASGPVPWIKAAQIAEQVAQGLAAAHDKGIVHRDVKPDNIFILTDGRVKVLDFGLARQSMAAEAGSDAQTRLTNTEPGTVMGTAGYMSPEQVKGRTADARSDIFSLGCVLFESATGVRAFARDTAAETMTAILHDEPAEAARPLPPAFDQVIRHCVEKRPEERFQSARDLAFALHGLATATTGIGSGRAAATTGSRPRLRPAHAAMVAAGILIGAVLTYFTGPARGTGRSAVAETTISSLLAPPETEFAFHHGFAISPDGRWVVFAARSAETGEGLWLRSLGEDKAARLPGTTGGSYPFWSPDSRYIGYALLDGRKMMRIAVDGGPPQMICAIPDVRVPRVSWGARGDILIGTDAPDSSTRALMRVPGSGGTAAPVPGFENTSAIDPMWLDEDRFVYRTVVRGEPSAAFVGSASNARPPIQIQGLTGVRLFHVAPGNRIVMFRRARVLYAQRFDPATFQLAGDPMVLGRAPGSPNDWLALSTTPDSLVMLAPEVADAGNPGDPLARLQWVNRRGELLGSFSGAVGRFWDFRLSPDGTRAAVNPDEDIWVFDQASTIRTRLTSHESVDFGPVWSPDGRQILYRRDSRTWLVPSTEAAQPVELPALRLAGATVTDWSRDGMLLFHSGSTGNDDIHVYDLEKNAAHPVLASPFNESGARFSPSGRWMAYVSDSTGQFEAYARPLDGSRPPVGISTGGGRLPFWRRDGKEIYFTTPQHQLVAVDTTSLETGGSVGPGQVLFRAPFNDVASAWTVDAAPDGRFLVNLLDTPEPLTLVRNWLGLLRK